MSSGIRFLDRTAITNTNRDERYFENPTYYEHTSATLNLTSGSVSNEESNNLNSSNTNCSIIHENGEDGPAYDVLSRGKATGMNIIITHMQASLNVRM